MKSWSAAWSGWVARAFPAGRQRTLGWVWLLGILAYAVASLLPLQPSYHVFFGVIPSDKLIHFVVFLLLSVYPVYFFTSRAATGVAMTVLVVMATASEALQAMVPYRFFSVMDLVASLLGCAAGYLLCRVWRCARSSRAARAKEPLPADDPS